MIRIQLVVHRMNFRFALIGLVLLLLVVELFVLFGTTPADPDLYGHLTFGSDILEQGTLPKQDPYSYTAGTTDWINHEWLSEVLFATVWHVLGFEGLHVLKVVFLGFYLYLFYLCLRELTTPVPILLHGVLTGVLGLILYPYLFVRPQLVTFLLTQLLLLLLVRFFKKRDRFLFLLPILFVIWTNAHGGFIAGLGLLGVAWVSSVLWYQGRFSTLSLVGFLSLLATLVNPYGYYIYHQLFRTFSNPYTDRLIRDWQSILSPDVYGHPVILTACLIAVGYLILFLRRQKTPLRKLLFSLTAVCFLVGLTDARNMVFVGLVGLPALAELLSEQTPSRPKLPHGRALIGTIVLTILLGSAGKFEPNPDGYFPEETVRYMKTREVSGNLAVPFNWGQYCIYHLYPKVKVSLDGRYDTVYPLSVFEDFELKAFRGRRWRTIFSRYGTELVLVPHGYPLHNAIKGTPAVERLYAGKRASLFRVSTATRTSPSN